MRGAQTPQRNAASEHGRGEIGEAFGQLARVLRRIGKGPFDGGHAARVGILHVGAQRGHAPPQSHAHAQPDQASAADFHHAVAARAADQQLRNGGGAVGDGPRASQQLAGQMHHFQGIEAGIVRGVHGVLLLEVGRELRGPDQPCLAEVRLHAHQALRPGWGAVGQAVRGKFQEQGFGRGQQLDGRGQVDLLDGHDAGGGRGRQGAKGPHRQRHVGRQERLRAIGGHIAQVARHHEAEGAGLIEKTGQRLRPAGQLDQDALPEPLPGLRHRGAAKAGN